MATATEEGVSKIENKSINNTKYKTKQQIL